MESNRRRHHRGPRFALRKLRPTKYFLSQELSAGCLSPTRADK